jgi:hypothetical protein
VFLSLSLDETVAFACCVLCSKFVDVVLLRLIMFFRALPVLFAGIILGAFGMWGVIKGFQQEDRDKDHVMEESVVAWVGSTAITVPQLAFAVRRNIGDCATEEEVRQVLSKLVNEAALNEVAEKQGFSQDSGVMLACRRFLAEKVREQELLPELERIMPTDEECRAYYRANKTQFVVPAQRRFAVLRLTGSGVLAVEQEAEQRKRMAEARVAALEADVAGFGKLAVTYSDHQATRYQGGDIGWIAEPNHVVWPAKVLAAGFDLKDEGQISPVLEVDGAFYLIKLMQRKASTVKPYETVKDTLRIRLLKKMREQARAAFATKVLEQVEVTVYEQNLAGIIASTDNSRTGMKPPRLPMVD